MTPRNAKALIACIIALRALRRLSLPGPRQALVDDAITALRALLGSVDPSRVGFDGSDLEPWSDGCGHPSTIDVDAPGGGTVPVCTRCMAAIGGPVQWESS